MAEIARPSELQNKLETFAIKGGATVLNPTNEYEIVRFKTSQGVCVIYRAKGGGVSFSGEVAKAAYRAFKSGASWSAVKIVRRAKRSKLEQTLIDRDGNQCFYCAAELEDPTLEHLLSTSHGGNNHLSNMVLACQKCNEEVGNMAIVDKIKLRDRKKSQ